MAAATVGVGQRAPGLLSRERIIAKPGFNRWLVPQPHLQSIFALACHTASASSGFHWLRR